MTKTSPFAPGRYEHEGQHLYYLPEDLFLRLTLPKPTCLVGTRGTGKTTLLKALSWEERKSNPLLKKELDALEGGPFESGYIGLYFKLPEQQIDLIDNWVSDVPVEVASRLTAFHLDLLWLELLCDAASHLIADETIPVSVSDERVCVQSVFREACSTNAFSTFASTGGPATFRELLTLLRSVRYQLETLAVNRKSFPEIASDYPTGQIGDFGRRVSKFVAETCSKATEGKQWCFKVCMDEGETLGDRQQHVINSLFRLAKWPVFPIIAYVTTPSDLSTTTIRGLTVSSDDSQVVVLDEFQDAKFRDFAEGVATVRIRHTLGDVNARFNTNQVFGRLDIDGMLNDMLKESVNPKSQRLLEDAKALMEHPFVKDNDSSEQNSAPPILLSYLIDKAGVELPELNSPQWKKRREDSQDYRKKFVAAYLSICHDLSLRVRYAFADMVLQMSDGCIRDFLSQLHEIFVESSLDLASFQAKPLHWKTQDAGLGRASNNKRDKFIKIVSVSPKQAFQIVDALGKLTARIQQSDPHGKHLQSTERGQFVIQCSLQTDSEVPTVLDIIDEAAQAGYLRILGKETDKWTFRVHTSLAPVYGFSYRGAMYPTGIRIEDLESFRTSKNEADLEKQVAACAKRIQKNQDLPLFDSKS